MNVIRYKHDVSVLVAFRNNCLIACSNNSKLHLSFENYLFRCWLKGPAFYGGFIFPITLILIGNFFIFAVIMNRLRLRNQDSPTCTKNEKKRNQIGVRHAFGLVSLFGLTWLFAFLAIGGASIIFQWLFTIFNSLQGLFIFICYCVLNKEVQDTWRRAYLGVPQGRRPSQTESQVLSTSGQQKGIVMERVKAYEGHARQALDTSGLSTI